MFRRIGQQDPARAHEEYVRALVMVAELGGPDARRHFVRRHAGVLGGYSALLLHLTDTDLQTAFRDAVRARDGIWPRTLMGLRLAVPKRLEERLADPWRAWRALGESRPGGLHTDPQGGDGPAEVRFLHARGGPRSRLRGGRGNPV